MGARFHWIANTAVAIFFVLGLILSGRHPWIFYLWLAAFLTFVAALLFSFFIQSAWQRKAPRAGGADASQRRPLIG
jgi:heme exporter protein D